MSSCSNTFSVSDIEKVHACLKGGKVTGFDNSQRAFVPDDFGIGTVVPIVKDYLADVTDVNNYRGITLCQTISKLFEYCLLHKYESHMDTSDV